MIKSRSEPGMALVAGFETSVYRMDDPNNLTVVLLDGPPDQPVQAVTIRLFWRPRAGRTPIDPTATNATIHYTIFTGKGYEEVGVYSGAGFVYPLSNPDEGVFVGDVWESTLRLSDRSEGFEDLLGGALLEGRLVAVRDAPAVSRALQRLSVLVTRGVGYPQWGGAMQTPEDAAGVQPALQGQRLVCESTLADTATR